jgi:hypothetical protein
MQPDAWGRYAANDATLIAEAERKSRGSRSRRTTRRIKDNSETQNVGVTLGTTASMTFGFTGPPQLEDDRVIQLCLLHSLGFFYFITYDYKARSGHVWPGKFLPVQWALKGDWGNPVHKAFSDAVSDWPVRVFGITGLAFFKATIRKHPTAMCWSWAYEWNQNVRIVGFFGEMEAARAAADAFPRLGGFLIRNGNEVLRFREEVSLADGEDKLFARRITKRSTPRDHLKTALR